jgi:hypothetical protein
MQLRMDFGIFQYESGQFEAAMRTLTQAFEFSIMQQPWTGADKENFKRSHAMLTTIRSLLMEWVKEANLRRKRTEEDQSQALEETKDVFALEDQEELI